MQNLYEKIDGAKNFSFLELIKSDTAIRLGMNNIPKDDNIWKNLKNLAVNCLQPIRDNFGPIKINSGYRSPELCIRIGSSVNSNHTKGEAADIEPFNDNIKLIDILNWIYKNLEFRELIAEYFLEGWIHIAYRENGNDKILKLKDKNHNYAKVTIDYINKLYK
jgi:hypothetical protein